MRPGTPRDPILRLRTRIQRALAGPAVFGPLPPFLPPVDRGWGRYPPRRQKPACGLAAGDVGLETGTIRSCPKDRHPRDGPPHCPFRFPSTGYTGAGVKIKNRGRNREHHGGDTARRGYDVAIGKVDNREVDFIAANAEEKRYIQVTESMNEPATRERELAPLRMIRDNYEKIVIAGSCDYPMTEDGIKIIKLTDFLLNA